MAIIYTLSEKNILVPSFRPNTIIGVSILKSLPSTTLYQELEATVGYLVKVEGEGEGYRPIWWCTDVLSK
jgi:hypothetical protein